MGAAEHFFRGALPKERSVSAKLFIREAIQHDAFAKFAWLVKTAGQIW
jgi:hypothetical protein